MSPAQTLLDAAEDLLTPGEVAHLLRVDPETVLRWKKDGKLSSVRTPGGHRRYPKGRISELLDAEPATGEVVEALEKVHALALEIVAHHDAERIARLLDVLRADG